MLMSELVQRIGRKDMKIIGRDSFLIFMFVYALIIAGVLRFLMPWLNEYLIGAGVMPGEFVEIPLSDVFPMLVAYMAFYAGAMLIGCIFGFVLIDEKDQNTLTAMMVTPVPMRQYVLYRAGAPVVFAFVVILGMTQVINQALLPFWQMVLFSLAASLTAPIITLLVSVAAANKIEAFAYLKFGGVAGMFIMIGYFVPEPLQWLFGLIPPFWVAKGYWLALEGREIWWLAWGVGVVSQLVLIRWLVGVFIGRAYR